MAPRILLACVLIGGLVVAVAVRSGDAAPRCPTPAMRAEIKAAASSLNRAVHDVEAAWLGGSRYAAAKVAVVDPQEVEIAAARQREAFYRLERARKACGA